MCAIPSGESRIIMYVLSAFDSLHSGGGVLRALVTIIAFANGILLQDSVRWKRETDRCHQHARFN